MKSFFVIRGPLYLCQTLGLFFLMFYLLSVLFRKEENIVFLIFGILLTNADTKNQKSKNIQLPWLGTAPSQVDSSNN